MVLSYVEFACQGGSGVALKVFLHKRRRKMKYKDFASDFQRAYWELFQASGDPRFISLFLMEEAERELKRPKLMEQELGR